MKPILKKQKEPEIEFLPSAGEVEIGRFLELTGQVANQGSSMSSLRCYLEKIEEDTQH